MMDADRIMAALAEACHALEAADEHAAAALVGQAMYLLARRHGVPVPPGPSPCRDDPS